MAFRICDNRIGRELCLDSASSPTLAVAAMHVQKANYLGGTHVKVVDGAEGMILYMPAESRHTAAHIQPRHHHTRDQLISNVVSQN